MVRRIQSGDLEAAIDALEAVAAEGRWIGTELPIDRDEWRSRWRCEIEGTHDSAMFVAEVDGRVVGTASVQGPGPTELGMSVLEAYRGRGLGRALLTACIDWAREVGSHKVMLHVWPDNARAISLYLQAGFEQEGFLRRHRRRKSGELRDVIVMGLLLPSNGSFNLGIVGLRSGADEDPRN